MAIKFAEVVSLREFSKFFTVDRLSDEASDKSANVQFNKPRAARDCFGKIVIHQPPNSPTLDCT
jgi:hypothetical protein